MEPAYVRAIHQVFATRYVEPSTVQEQIVVRTSVTSAPANAWWPGIWAPRPMSSDSGDFYDTHDVRQRRFDLEWSEAVWTLKLTKVIAQAEQREPQEGEDTDGGTAVDEVGSVLCENAGWLYPLFQVEPRGSPLDHSLDTTLVGDHHVAHRLYRVRA